MIKPNIYEEKLERSFFIIFFKLEAIENLIYNAFILIVDF